MRDAILVGLICFCFMALGLILGSIQQTTTYKEDVAGCENVCEPNGGIKRCATFVDCVCKNGANFDRKNFK